MASERVLVVAAHPDDELLGCGATVARHAAGGDVVDTLILAQGVTSRGAHGDEAHRELQELRTAARRAAEVVGANPPHFGELPDNRLDTVALLDVVQIIEEVIADTRPTVIYTHHGGDLNIDHRVAHAAVLTACRPLPGRAVRAVYAFETPSSTEWGASDQDEPFRPDRFHDVSAHLETKLRALACYESEMRGWPHARSHEAVEALAKHRGATVGLEAAEAFRVLRQLA